MHQHRFNTRKKHFFLLTLFITLGTPLLNSSSAIAQTRPTRFDRQQRIRQARQLDAQFEIEKAFSIYTEILHNHKTSGNSIEKGNILLALGNLYTKKAILNGESISSFFREKSTAKTSQITQLSQEQVNNYSQALKHLEQAQKISIDSNDEWLELQTAVSLAMLDSTFLDQKGKFEEYTNRTLELLESKNVPKPSINSLPPFTQQDIFSHVGVKLGQYPKDKNFIDSSTDFTQFIAKESGQSNGGSYSSLVTARAITYQNALDTFNFKNLKNLWMLEGVILGNALSTELPEEEKQSFFDAFEYSTSAMVAFHQRNPNDRAAFQLSLNTILFRKSLVSDMLRRDQLPSSNQLDTIQKQLKIANQASSLFLSYGLNAATTNTCSATHSSLHSQEQAAQIRAVCSLQARQEDGKHLHSLVSLRQRDLNDQLLKSQSFQEQENWGPDNAENLWKSVQQNIPGNSALIEFIKYRPYNPQKPKSERWEPPRYAAYLLFSKGQPQTFDIGDAAEIDPLITQFRESLSHESDIDQLKTIGQNLEAKLTRPFRQQLSPATHLLISPDNQLNLLPFDALVDEKGRYLVENYAITYLTSGRDLLDSKRWQKTTKKRVPLIVANPDFSTQLSSSTGNERRSTGIDILECCEPLAYAEREADALRKLMPDAKVLTQSKATKDAVKQVASPKILHLATHGFFLEDQVPSLYAQAIPNANAMTDLENPLLRSGLAFAGFDPKSGQFDGALTALEVNDLDLQGTELVVLSACQTGIGKVKNGDGVHGLRRSFFLAGAESLVMSLWAVDDQATYALMNSYYSRLLQGEGRGKALRNTQLGLLNTDEYWHPYYWAAFIQSGNWKSL